MIEFIEHDIELNPIVLDDRVLVYRDVLPDVENLYRIVRESEETGEGRFFLKTWDQWSKFGTYSQAKWSEGEQLGSEFGKRFDEEKYFAETIDKAYNIVVGDYFKRTGTELPESSRFSGCSFCKYDRGIDTLRNELTMQYHTDYVIAHRDMPGEKFYVTCTMYINDDYNGGDIAFWVNGKEFSWKPKAGDIVVFPSNEPYWHGVKTINDGEKFFVRNFVMVDYEGNPEWLANKEKYGEEKWAEMEAERLEYEAPRNMLYIDKATGERITYEQALANR